MKGDEVEKYGMRKKGVSRIEKKNRTRRHQLRARGREVWR